MSVISIDLCFSVDMDEGFLIFNSYNNYGNRKKTKKEGYLINQCEYL